MPLIAGDASSSALADVLARVLEVACEARSFAAAVAAEHSSKVDSSMSSLAGMLEALRSDAGLQKRVERLTATLYGQHRFVSESAQRLRMQAAQGETVLAAAEKLLRTPVTADGGAGVPHTEREEGPGHTFTQEP